LSARVPEPGSLWTVDVPKVETTAGNLSVVVVVKGPEDAPGKVWAGLTAEKPDGTYEDTPIVAIPHDKLGTPVTLTHAIGDGYTTFAVGVWKQEPPSCAGQPDCAGRLAHLPAALVTWPAQPSTSVHPLLDKIDRRVRVRFLDLSRSGTLSKVVRQAVATRLAFYYPGPGYRLFLDANGDAGDPRSAVLVRYRDPSDDIVAESLAIDLRKALTDVGVVTEHAPDLPVAFVIDMGGDAQATREPQQSGVPKVMHRPGR